MGIMGPGHDAEQRESLKKALCDHKVLDVAPPTESETMFVLFLEHLTTGKRKTVEIGGTDLGWWFTEKKRKSKRKKR